MKSLPVVPKLPAITLLKSRSLALPMLFACLLLLSAPAAHGQVTNVDDSTSTPIEGVGHNYIKMLSETVNPAQAKPELHHPEAIAPESTGAPASGDPQQL